MYNTFLSLLAIENIQNHFILFDKKIRQSKKANLKGTLLPSEIFSLVMYP
jgi:hypothetical protein